MDYKIKNIVTLVVLVCLCATPVFSFQKKIALPFDDLPCLESYSSLEKVIQINQSIINTLKKHSIKSVVFVNEQKIHYRGETESRIKILEEWVDNGHELGNHTVSHKDASKISMEEFKGEVRGGEETIGSIMRSRGKNLRFFRYPYLVKGRNFNQIKQTERFLRGRKYIIAGATLDSLDWKFNAKYRQAAAQYGEDSPQIEEIKEAFLAHVQRELSRVSKRKKNEIFLLHACTLTSVTIGRVIDLLKRNGYSFCTLEEALKDCVLIREIEH
ncbi:MAG: polysaccharide deacetylase family protein [Puniceicoccales bacterium]|nr:polysaccharide deacetylase family protein [Puniceicoccales bacterium]